MLKPFLKKNKLTCNCAGSFFLGKDHHCSLTGDLQTVRNSKLRKLFTKDPKYRENTNISLEKNKSSIINGIDFCINTWCSKHGIDQSALME